jgi:hypothetical protein
LHSFDGKCPFSRDDHQRIKDLKKLYALDLDARASHRLMEGAAAQSSKKMNERLKKIPDKALPGSDPAASR